MRKLATLAAAAALAAFGSTASAWAVCTTVQDGTLLTSDGDVITPGYDQYGYNYGARIFNGDYCDYLRSTVFCPFEDPPSSGQFVDYGDIDLIMKWNDAWLSNKDCDGDSKLDRHFGSSSYQGSEAWLTNHQAGKVDVGGKLRKWTYFVKIVAVPLDANNVGGVWYTTDGIEIGPSIWGPFAIIEEVLNDPSVGAHGVVYKSPAGPGFGHID
jgi:hypothetical protein